jgi:hypothetical protein
MSGLICIFLDPVYHPVATYVPELTLTHSLQYFFLSDFVDGCFLFDIRGFFLGKNSLALGWDGGEMGESGVCCSSEERKCVWYG